MAGTMEERTEAVFPESQRATAGAEAPGESAPKTNLLAGVVRALVGVATLAERAANLGASLIILGLMFMIVADVSGRFLFNSPVPDSLALGATAMAFIVFLPMAYAQAKGQNIKVELLWKRYTPTQRAVFESFAGTLGAVILALIVWKSWMYFWDSWTIRELMQSAQLRVPFYIGKFAVPVGAFLLCLQFLIDAGREISSLVRRKV